MIRLDRFLCDCGAGTRSQVKAMIKKGQVMVNGTVVKTADGKIDESTDKVCLNGKELAYQTYFYYMLHKPQGVVSATKDKQDKTVMDLLKDAPGKDLFPVGRLDKDTEGLLLITNDGDLSHALLSPKKHVKKTYLVRTAEPITKAMVEQLEAGVDIGEDKPTLPAKVEVISDREIHLTITEGKFHQVKRMLHAVGNEVVYLKRLSMGSLQLDADLACGKYRPLTIDEIFKLSKSK